MPAKNKLIITRTFNAPRRLLFQAWTDPQRVSQWWGPAGFTNPVCDLEARAGGAIRIHMRAPDGTVYPMRGEFREVAEPERIVFLSSALDPADRPLFTILTTVTFADKGPKTELTLLAEVVSAGPEAPQYLAGMEAGWNQSLDRFGAHLRNYAEGRERELVISRDFAAPREMVWDAWTDPKQVVRWWGPNGFTSTIETMDLRPGGAWNMVMHGPDGVDYPNYSVFTEVEKPERIRYTHGGGRKGGPDIRFEATWTFEKIGQKTRLTVRMVFPDAAARDSVVNEFGALEGGEQTLARLAEFLANPQT